MLCVVRLVSRSVRLVAGAVLPQPGAARTCVDQQPITAQLEVVQGPPLQMDSTAVSLGKQRLARTLRGGKFTSSSCAPVTFFALNIRR